CVAMLEADPQALTVFSVSPCGRNPYFNQVQEKADGYYGVVLGGMYTSRQTAPKVYDMNASVYVYRREALMAEPPRAVTPRSLVYVMNHLCFDLDEPSDFDYLTWLVDTG
ncbi:acylneuraminate cytidylyltransferase family protein, partial [Parabacteroides distasonis]